MLKTKNKYLHPDGFYHPEGYGKAFVFWKKQSDNMTTKLVQILSNLSELMGDWNSRAVPTEKEFVDELRELARKLVVEVDKQGMPVKEIK